MSGFTLTEHIARPVEEVFAFTTGTQNASRWLGDVTKIEMLTPGPMRVGSKFRETRRIKGKEHSAVIEVTEHAPPHRHAASATMMGVTATYHYTFSPHGDGTKIDMKADVHGRGLAKLLVPMVLSTMKKQDGDQLARLKAAMGG